MEVGTLRVWIWLQQICASLRSIVLPSIYLLSVQSLFVFGRWCPYLIEHLVSFIRPFTFSGFPPPSVCAPYWNSPQNCACLLTQKACASPELDLCGCSPDFFLIDLQEHCHYCIVLLFFFFFASFSYFLNQCLWKMAR